MADEIRHFGVTSNKVRVMLQDKTTFQGKTGLTNASTGLIISTCADNEASGTAYSGANILTIAAIGTFAAPTAGKCRFGEVDGTNQKGVYELQFLDARFAVASSKRLVISITDGATSILDKTYVVDLWQPDPFDAVRFGLTSLPATACTTPGNSLITSGSGTDQMLVSSGVVSANANVTTWNSVSVDPLSSLADQFSTFTTTQMTESYRAAGTAPSVAQMLFEQLAGLLDHHISGVTKTIRKIDGTTAKTYTLDDATHPLSITETS